MTKYGTPRCSVVDEASIDAIGKQLEPPMGVADRRFMANEHAPISPDAPIGARRVALHQVCALKSQRTLPLTSFLPVLRIDSVILTMELVVPLSGVDYPPVELKVAWFCDHFSERFPAR